MENPFELILEKLNTIENTLMTTKKIDPILSTPVNEIFNIDQTATYLGLSKPTLYHMTSTRLIPHYKVSKKIYFKRNEIDLWISKHKIKTNVEIEQEANEYLFKKRKYR